MVKLCLMAPVNDTGYGFHGANMLKALHELGHEVVWFPIGEPRPQRKIQQIVARCHYFNHEWDRDTPCVKIWHEHDQTAFVTDRRFAFPVWEMDKIPLSSVRVLNKVDRVIVPSRWQAQSYRESGGSRPVRVVPEGVDTDIFRHEPLDLEDGFIRFIHIGKVEERKCSVQIAEAFTRVFGDRGDVLLNMYIANPFLTYQEKEVWERRFGERRNIKIHWNYLGDESRVASLLNSSQVAIYASRAEGWCLPVLEAMACGLHVVTTNNTGMSEYVTNENAYVVESGPLVPAHDNKFFRGQGSWHEVSTDSLAEQIERAWRAAHESRLNQNALATAEHFTWKSAANKLIDTVFPDNI